MEREVTINFESLDIKNTEGVFYTDSNGLEIVKRVYKEVDSNNTESGANVAANYYPINSAIFIEDVETGR